MAKKKAEGAPSAEALHDGLLDDLRAILDGERDPQGALELLRTRLDAEARCADADPDAAPVCLDSIRERAPRVPISRGQVDIGGPRAPEPELPPGAVAELAPPVETPPPGETP